MLAIVTPWMASIGLTDDSISRAVLHNLFYLTIRFGDEYVAEIEQLWTQLVTRRYGPSVGAHTALTRHARPFLNA